MLKKTLLTTLAITCFSFFSFSENIIYVKQGALGSGASWEDATGDLQYALSIATAGDELWVAEGTYLPTTCDQCTPADRTISFKVPNGVKLYGGFLGNEKRLNQRNWRKRPARLSGNIGRNTHFDNSYSVVYFSNNANAIILDGFIIADGNADSYISNGAPQSAGGAIYFDRCIGKTNVPIEVKNCLFLNNKAIDGGAIYVNESFDNPIFHDCTFTNNSAVNRGGAIYHRQINDSAKPTVNYCQFVNNDAVLGAGIFSECLDSEIDPAYMNSTFANNKASHGSGMYFMGLTECPSLRTNRYINNHSLEGKQVNEAEPRSDQNEIVANLTDGFIEE